MMRRAGLWGDHVFRFLGFLVLAISGVSCSGGSEQGPGDIREHDRALYQAVLEEGELPIGAECTQLFVLEETVSFLSLSHFPDQVIESRLEQLLPTSSQKAREDFELRNGTVHPIPPDLTASNLASIGPASERWDSGFCGQIRFSTIGYGRRDRSAIVCTEVHFSSVNATVWCSLWERTSEGWLPLARGLIGMA